MKERVWRVVRAVFGTQQAGLILVIMALFIALSFAGRHVDPETQEVSNTFLTPYNLFNIATMATDFAIMAVGMTLILINNGIDLSVGSVYALAGVCMAMIVDKIALHSTSTPLLLIIGIVVCLGIGFLCGLMHGTLTVLLRVHPFIITLGSMLALRGLVNVIGASSSFNIPVGVKDVMKTTFGLPAGFNVIPMLVVILVMILGALFLSRTVPGRQVFAIGGNEDAARFSGIAVWKVRILVFGLAGLCAGIAAFVKCTYSGGASCNDAQGYELYVIASAVIGGASLLGGKGNAFGAVLGAILIALIQQAIAFFNIDPNYQSIVIGCAVVVAVVIDQTTARINARRLATAAADAREEERERLMANV